jgi:hypothetical protein
MAVGAQRLKVSRVVIEVVVIDVVDIELNRVLRHEVAAVTGIFLVATVRLSIAANTVRLV